jgi:pyruvate formate lyase activating enzyme
MTAIELFIENPPRRFHLERMNKPQSAPLREAIAGVPGRYWERLADGRIQCDLCPRYCKLHDGQRGLCFVRARRRNPAHHYGRFRLLHRPDREKALKPFSARNACAVVRHGRCNLTCKFCQNWDISKARSFDSCNPNFAEAIVRCEGDWVARDRYTYNDP